MILLKSIIFGFLITIPTGPMGFVIVREMYLSGRKTWIPLALGGIISDVFYGSIVVLGLHYIQAPLLHIQYPLRIIAGLALLFIGIRSLRKARHKAELKPKLETVSNVSGAILACITNPTHIITFTLVLSTLGISVHRANSIEYIIFLAGMMLGVLCVWFTIEQIITRLHLNHTHDELFAMISAWVIIATGVLLVLWALIGIGSQMLPSVFYRLFV